MYVGLLGANAVMSPTNDIANLIKQSGPRRRRFDGNLLLAVFPTENDSHFCVILDSHNGPPEPSRSCRRIFRRAPVCVNSRSLSPPSFSHDSPMIGLQAIDGVVYWVASRGVAPQNKAPDRPPITCSAAPARSCTASRRGSLRARTSSSTAGRFRDCPKHRSGPAGPEISQAGPRKWTTDSVGWAAGRPRTCQRRRRPWLGGGSGRFPFTTFKGGS